jgi:hypothetical protein
VLTATVATLPDEVAGAEVRAPTLIIIGGVVKLREQLGWFEGGAGIAPEVGERIWMDHPD